MVQRVFEESVSITGKDLGRKRRNASKETVVGLLREEDLTLILWATFSGTYKRRI